MTEVFSEIYRRNLWNGVESRSGPGSGSAATDLLVPELLALVDELGVRSVLDVACGDGFWMPDLPNYLGIDVAPEAIRLATERHPDRAYRIGDVRDLQLEAFDLVIFRDALQHLSFVDGQAALDAIRATGSTWLLASTYVGGENIDIETGDCFSPDLEDEPFSLGPPVRLIIDGFTYHDRGTIRDPRKMLGLWRLTP